MIPVAKPYLTKTEAETAADVILSGWVTQGSKVEEFEKKFASFVGSKYAVCVSNCTAALHLSLIVSGVRAGDEIICPSMSFIATANSIRHAGGVPVFADCEKETYNIDPISAEKLITKRTKGILIVHQMGWPADIDAFKKICLKHSLVLIEDAACAVGSEYKGKKIGSHSDLVCFSFHPRKVITTGDGGMITTSNKDYYERLKRLRQHGMSVNDRERHFSNRIINEDYLELGYNYRMTDIQAAVGIKQLEKINYLIKERTKLAEFYNKAFAKTEKIILPKIDPKNKPNFQSYPIYFAGINENKRDEIMQKLLDVGISTRRGIMLAHKTSAYCKYKLRGKLSASEDLSSKSILLPLYNGFTKNEASFVIKNLKKTLEINETDRFQSLKGRMPQILERPFLYNLIQDILGYGSEKLILKKLKEIFRFVSPDENILDVGCGPSSRLWKLGYKPFGLDISKSYVSEFNKTCDKAKLGSADTLPFKKQEFKIVWSFGLLHHLEDNVARKSILEMIRVCKKNGEVLIFDAVLPVSFWFYPFASIIRKFDRGCYMRTEADFDSILPQKSKWEKERYIYAKTGLELLILTYRK